MSERTVITNANVITMAAAEKRCQAVAIENDRIIRTGTEAEMQDLVRQDWPVVDLKGQTVLPGFIDTHEHLMLTGSQEVAVHLNDVTDIDDILTRISDRASQTPKGEWVRGGYLNEQGLTEKRMPTRDDLDRVSGDHPLFLLHATCHMCSLNTRALEIINPPGDLEGLDLESGRPTGVVRDPGILTFIHPAMARIIPEAEKIEFLTRASEMGLIRV
jgi:predicted amidohydrolase YtcJ